MGATMSVIKTLIVPAVISLILFLVSTYVLLPLWRKWRSRYSQYLPIDTISTSTVSLRHRIQSGIARMIVPSTWSRNAHERLVVATDTSDDEEGEELGDVGEQTRRAVSDDTPRNRHDSTRRLSRDLEEGFRDDSEGSDDDDNNGRDTAGSWR